MALIAQLAMYDRPETAAANDRFWALIRDILGNGPATLSRDLDVWEAWQSPDLLLAQTCGMPYRTALHDKVTLVGTPDYGLPGCGPGYYRSIFVARRGAARKLSDLDGARFAFNEPLSQSGWAAPVTHMTSIGIAPGSTLQTGAHRVSAEAVAEGRADFASLDALSWQLMQTYDGFAADLVEIGQTEPTPGLPLITAQGRDPAPLFDAVKAAIPALSRSDRATLHLKDIVRIDPAAYLAIPTPSVPK